MMLNGNHSHDYYFLFCLEIKIIVGVIGWLQSESALFSLDNVQHKLQIRRIWSHFTELQRKLKKEIKALQFEVLEAKHYITGMTNVPTYYNQQNTLHACSRCW